MNPRLIKVGNAAAPVVILDQVSGSVDEVVELAEALAPFPALANNYYPGLRRVITPDDSAANGYVERLCQTIAPFIAGAFACDGFDLIEASFSMVTTPPERLAAAQRAPHFDSTDARHLAVLHYLSLPAPTGTAFFRQRATGIERVDDANLSSFVRTAERDAALLGGHSGYIAGSDPYYEQIGSVEGVADRLVIYQGCLLHSGIIPPGMELSGNPRQGRLTANLFVRAH